MNINNKGFTLMEIVLAVVLVGIIGVALASLTLSASRESGRGQSKTALRNNFSIAMRQLRLDVQNSSRILYTRGKPNGVKEALLCLAQNVDLQGNAITGTTAQYITYYFIPGGIKTRSDGSKVEPNDSTDGGIIKRVVSTTNPLEESSLPTSGGKEAFVNVKYIKPTSIDPYYAPFFAVVRDDERQHPKYYDEYKATEGTFYSRIDMNIIMELPSSPVVNDAMEETLVLPIGL